MAIFLVRSHTLLWALHAWLNVTKNCKTFRRFLQQLLIQKNWQSIESFGPGKNIVFNYNIQISFQNL